MTVFYYNDITAGTNFSLSLFCKNIFLDIVLNGKIIFGFYLTGINIICIIVINKSSLSFTFYFFLMRFRKQ